MQETLSCLIKLQQVDSQIYEIEKTRDVYPARVREIEKKIEEQQVLYEERKAALEEVQAEHKKKLDAFLAEQEKLRKWERRLMESKNHREAAPLAREIDAQKRLNEEAEEEIKALKEEVDAIKEEVALLSKTLKSLKSELSKESKISKAKIKEFDEQLKALNEARKEFTQKLRSSVLRKYELIKKRRQGLAIVPVRDGCCTGCNMMLRPQLYNSVQKVQTLETCPGCQRILYWEEGLENDAS